MKDNETIIWVIVAVVAITFLGGYGMMGLGGMRNMMYGSYETGAIFFGWIYGFLVLIVILLFIVLLIKKINNEDKIERKYKIFSQTRNAFERRSKK